MKEESSFLSEFEVIKSENLSKLVRYTSYEIVWK